MLKTAIQMNFKEHRQALFNIKIKFQKGQLKMSDYLAVTMVITCAMTLPGQLCIQAKVPKTHFRKV